MIVIISIIIIISTIIILVIIITIVMIRFPSLSLYSSVLLSSIGDAKDATMTSSSS